MGDYISRQAVLVEAEKVPLRERDYRNYGNVVQSIPAADVVEVVRCYECKYCEHRPDRQYDICAYFIGAKHSCTPEDFCSCGKRKDGGQDGAPAKPYDLLYEEGGPDA